MAEPKRGGRRRTPWIERPEACQPGRSTSPQPSEWDEAYSIGLAGLAEISYPELPAGFYRFRINELSLMGSPGEAETSLGFEVPMSFWRTPSFWGLVVLLCLSGTAGVYRYVGWQQMRRRLAVLESQRALEHERLRIAQDIHDDLGARVTQISLVSGLANMRRRLEHLGGTCSIQSQRGRGTTVSFRLNLKPRG